MQWKRARQVEVSLITLLLMAWIGAGGYVTLAVWEWEPLTAKIAVGASTLALAAVLLARFDRRWRQRDGLASIELAGEIRERQLRARAEELRGDPRRARYASEVEAGRPITDAQIDYRENPEARASCRHLRALEGAMRAAGVVLTPLSETALAADCRIDEDSLRNGGGLDPVVAYSASEDERGRGASLTCGICGYTIHVRHPSIGGTVYPG